MKRSVLALVVGFVVWWLVASLLDRGLRFGFAGYAAAEPAMAFTLGMKIARLILGALSSLAAGATTRLIAPSKAALPWVLGVILLAMFIPVHVGLWTRFPVWYHLTFLGTLAPLVALGGAFIRGRMQPDAARS
jgi:hypothetical protein